MALTRDDAVRRLVVALDTSTRERAMELAAGLSGRVGMFKIGLEAFTASGPSLVDDVQALGHRVFLDLKLHDIPNTVQRAAMNCARLGVAIFNVHAGGGRAMLEAAVEGARAATPAGATPPQVLAVTVLTSLDDAALADLGVSGAADEIVLRWARMAQQAGCDGVVCSPREAARLRRELGPEFVLLTPGIRPAGESRDDQRRTATPADAVAAGSTYLVLGRPITGAAHPAEAADAVVDEVLSALETFTQ